MLVLLTEVYRHTALHGAIAPRELVPVLVHGHVVEIVRQNIVQVQVHPHLNDNFYNRIKRMSLASKVLVHFKNIYRMMRSYQSTPQ